MKAWAAKVVGKPYRAGAVGPDAFDCIGLVRHYFRTQQGVELPDYTLLGSSVEDLLRFTRATGWRRAEGQPQEQDLLLMTGLEGRHVGIVVETSEGLGLLHATGSEQRGQVLWQPLDTLFGYRNIEVWRRVCT